jgi:hypothetical protein
MQLNRRNQMTPATSNSLAREALHDRAGFFFRPLFRSGQFVAVSILFAALVVVCIAILVVYRSRLSWPLVTVLFLIVVPGGAGSMYRSLWRHARLHEMYLAGKIDHVEPESPLGVALDVAADSIIDGLAYTLMTELLLLLLIAYFLHRFQ